MMLSDYRTLISNDSALAFIAMGAAVCGFASLCGGIIYLKIDHDAMLNNVYIPAATGAAGTIVGGCLGAIGYGFKMTINKCIQYRREQSAAAYSNAEETSLTFGQQRVYGSSQSQFLFQPQQALSNNQGDTNSHLKRLT